MSMSDDKMRIVSDRFGEMKAHHEEMGMMDMGDQMIPVDMYGKRVWPAKSESNRKEAAEDIQEYYGLTGKKGLS